jgi:hypothetical protein
MQPKTKPIPTKRFLEVSAKTKSWHPVERNGWIIKFSQYRDSNILLFIVSRFTGQTIVRYFSHEDAAVLFINMLVELAADEIYDL